MSLVSYGHDGGIEDADDVVLPPPWANRDDRPAISAAANKLRTLAAIEDEAMTVATLGGMVGTRALAASVYNHLQGADPEETRAQADLLDHLAEARP